MFLIVTRGGETRRIEIPLDVERAGTAEAWAATCDPNVWTAAEVVSPNWPLPPLEMVVAPLADAPVMIAPPAPDTLILDEE